jgi:hypothetical protein
LLQFAEKTDIVLIYGEARGHSELPRQIYAERILQGTFVNVVQHEDRILVAEEIQERHFQQHIQLMCGLG